MKFIFPLDELLMPALVGDGSIFSLVVFNNSLWDRMTEDDMTFTGSDVVIFICALDELPMSTAECDGCMFNSGVLDDSFCDRIIEDVMAFTV